VSNRPLTVGLLMMVTISAFQALGVGTVLPAAARELGGLDAYGWAFSATMLASVAGNVAAGQAADGRGPVRPFLAGSAVFAAGCVVAAAAGDWPVMLAGRALEGAGLGAIGALTYVALARAYPPEQYGRVLALTSAAWVLPSLVGPPLAGVIADVLSWRAVFVLFLPLVPVGIALTLPSLRRMERGPQAARAPSRLGRAAALIAGFGLFLFALELDPVPALVLGAGGAALAAPALRRLLPAGTLRVARGLPASIAVRGALAVAYLGCDAFLPLALVRLRGLTLTQAGLVLSAGSVSWSLGAIVQGRRDRRDKGAGRAARALAGAAVLGAGLALTAPVLVDDALAPGLAVVGWVVGGLGMGLAYSSIGALALAAAPADEEGSVSSALLMVETVSVAVFTGLGGAVIALGLERGWDGETALGVIFAAGVAAAVGAVTAGRRVQPSAMTRAGSKPSTGWPG
jgi:MFS family permease